MAELKLSSLEGLPPEQLNKEIQDFFSTSFDPPNGAMTEIKAEIADLEEFYGMSSEEMLSKITSGEIRETKEFADWAISYKTLNN